MAQTCILHIGYPKTGTTSFQERIIPQFPHLHRISGGWEDGGYMNALLYEWEIPFQLNLNRYRQNLLDHIQKKGHYDVSGDEGVFLLSDESLLVISMIFRFVPHPFIYVPDPVSIARKLKILFCAAGLFDTVKVVITIRRQAEMLRSMYAQMYHYAYSKFSCTRTFQKFLDYTFEENFSNFIGSMLLYDEVVAAYQELFGAENVVVLVYEDLAKGNDVFFKNFGAVLKIVPAELKRQFDANRMNVKSGSEIYRLDKRSLRERLSYYSQRFFPKLGEKVKQTKFADVLKKIEVPGGATRAIHFPPGKEEMVMQRYAQSNRALAQRCGLDLKQHNYF